ncbi:DNA-binding transcriptional activator of the SARP family [Micromonospora phaseoli]|uniref:DNA-binding transcriptional activator of the SARP family n=1 Tax=Micromonospora phaseoli TaxID=1144548 RepID=A0A1H7DQ44_9ACTN|nr:BTAD domain-containing putative transcriptional regulator [Micromonospora phaseoli]PZW02387.1 DNA-binding SARP family transcriptional activator [Micromonospora phaseoli]GIJ75611.1 SARP family transcriptional regulator [Micromonospora phaseoli]SEK01752.1 DNA-binding transcriptional activator of the SARP family [Micromonospora phaseoli]
MRFGILGTLRVGGGEATVTAGRDRIVLAMLLLRAGRIVPVDELVDAVWEDRPPATARAQLQTCVSRLRQRLAALGLPPELIVTDPGGYLIRTAAGEVDAETFGREVDAGRAALAGGQLVDARRHFRAALTLWRGPALGGIASRSVRRRAQALDEQRLTALEECVDVELRLGHAADLLDELTEAVERHPLRERLRGHLMLALSAVGRQADALAVYREGRRLYAEELGIEPGAALQELHQRVLAGDLAMAGSQRTTTVAVRGLPRAISDFTGRQDTLTRLLNEIEEGGARIHLIDGMAGSGKTTLAVHLADRLGHRYPDAQLFIDLHGYSERTPLTPAAATATLLRQLGVPAERIPVDLDDRLALWRTELSGRRALVLLDNAAGADQVMPLLPPGGACLTLITSRRRLVGVDEGRPCSLPVLDLDEAIELLGRVAGADRVVSEPEAAAEVARRCGFLPLAIRLAGARLAHRPGWRIADLVDRLAGARDPLAELVAGNRSVGDAFALSYAQVSPAAQRLFRLLGLHPGVRFDSRVAAALVDLPLEATQDLLDELVDAHLVEEPGAGRFRLHDLVREYARRLLTAPDRAADRHAALERLLDHHLHVAAAIARDIELPFNRATFRLPGPNRPDLVAASASQGRAWFEENHAALTALVGLAEAEGFLTGCWQLARVCWRANYDGGHLDELIETHTVALRAAEKLGDDEAVANTLNYLASGHHRLAQYSEAIRLMEMAVDIYRRLGRTLKLHMTLANLGSCYTAQGDYRNGKEHFEAAGALVPKLDVPDVLANWLNNLSFALLIWGRHDEALRTSRTHLLLARQNGDERQLGHALGHVGMIRRRMGHTGPARRLLNVALRLKRKTGNLFGYGEVLNEIGLMEREAGRPDKAAACHREALLVIIESGDRVGMCTSRNLLARAILEQGDAPSALDLFRRVLHDATKINNRYEQAQALDGIARCLRTTEPAAARAHWVRALALFRQLDLPERYEVQRLLAELS